MADNQNFETSYSQWGIGYIRAFSTQIVQYANVLGVSPLGVAGSVLREIGDVTLTGG